MLLFLLPCLSFLLMVIKPFISPPIMGTKHFYIHEVGDEEEVMSILDLPELALECILRKLSPAGLSSMAGVCTSLRERCRSDYLWERHMREKWGRVLVGSAAAEEKWRLYLASGVETEIGGAKRRWVWSVSSVWPLSWLTSRLGSGGRETSVKLDDSIMSMYLAMERGEFWFPAQVYNRENGHLGFMMSCYDAELCYDRRTNTFKARYPPHGRRTIATEEGLQWDRLRAAPIDTSPHDLHVSDCLSDLRPGDHVEIQWRRNKEFPYGLSTMALLLVVGLVLSVHQ